MRRHIQVAMLGLIVLVVGVVAACGGSGIPDDVEWEARHVKSGGTTLGLRSSDPTYADIAIEINREVTCNEILAIAKELRDEYPSSKYVHNWIGFYLPGISMQMRVGEKDYFDTPNAWSIVRHMGDQPAELVRKGCEE